MNTTSKTHFSRQRSGYGLGLLLLALVLVVSGCKKDGDLPEVPPAVQNDPEVITTLTLTFNDGTTSESFTFRDPDGDGGNGPDIFDSIALKPQTTYAVTIALLNETVSPAEDITVEVQEEGAEHFFCFTPAGGANVTVTATDSDGTFPIGIQSEWVTGAAGTGTVRVILKHQPDGLKDGTCTPGETDVDVEFNLTIQ